jgi:hypothetical protein
MGINVSRAGNADGRATGLAPNSQEVADEVELIVQSSIFRSSPALRQLLKFLTESLKQGRPIN